MPLQAGPQYIYPTMTMSNNVLKILIGTAAGVVIIGGSAWGVSVAVQHFSRQKAIKECTPDYARLGLSAEAQGVFAEIDRKYGEESFAECMARNGQNPAPWAR